ncbi:exported hypothetical protein [Crenothrix polyspora]|uniref:Uncharacterized protein n=1 Tax=Crenothrix polyspora TaxID=360316 RepID=A0A1R4HB14_9GAMM|nr:hypothetical protein [Crenothrix polyspora]SJM93448.1 exported hypothetical protein [Crenothrix polyspora]
MNKHSKLFFPISVVAFALYSVQALSAVPPVDVKGVPALATCAPSAPNQQVLHFDKIIFIIKEKLLAASTIDQNQLSALPLNSELDIKVKDNPRTVADLKGKILTFLGAALDEKNRLKIQVIDVEYAVICAKPLN